MAKSIAEIDEALKALPNAEVCLWTDDRYHNGGVDGFIEDILHTREDRTVPPKKVWGSVREKYSLPSACDAAELAWEGWADHRATSDIAEVLIDEMIEIYFDDVDVDAYEVEHLGETELQKAIEDFIRANREEWATQFPEMNTGKLIGVDDLQKAIDACSTLYDLVGYVRGSEFVELTPEWWEAKGWKVSAADDATLPNARAVEEMVNGKS
jgi:hypothetical protein